MDHIYDVIILGAGPAGLSAGLYAGRSRLDTLIIEKGQAGGQIINTDEIENYPGQIVEGETGVSLVRRMYEQTEQFGAEHVRDTITNAELSGDIKVLTGEKDTYQAKNIIIATGAYARPIGCKGEQEYKGRGISYCATCDANFFTDLEVYVAGGGDAAVEEALYLTKFARKVTIIHRRDELRAAKSIQEKAFANPKITFLWDFVTAIDEKHIILVKSLQSTDSYPQVEQIAKELVTTLNMEAMVSVRAAYGTIVEELKDVSRSYKEADMALEVGRVFYTEKKILAYNELGIGRLIHQLPATLCEMFLNEVFEDGKADIFEEEELTTVYTFFDNNLNISETARRLYVHRNTLVYRLEKIQKKTGLDVRVFDDALTFKIAMMVADHMKYMKE